MKHFLSTFLNTSCSGLATNLPEVLIVRFVGAVAGSSMVSIAPGTVRALHNLTIFLLINYPRSEKSSAQNTEL